jgi:hypothetical protein
MSGRPTTLSSRFAKIQPSTGRITNPAVARSVNAQKNKRANEINARRNVQQKQNGGGRVAGRRNNQVNNRKIRVGGRGADRRGNINSFCIYLLLHYIFSEVSDDIILLYIYIFPDITFLQIYFN